LKRRAFHDREYPRRDSIIVARRLASDGANRRVVVRLDAAADRIGEELFGSRPDEIVTV